MKEDRMWLLLLLPKYCCYQAVLGLCPFIHRLFEFAVPLNNGDLRTVLGVLALVASLKSCEGALHKTNDYNVIMSCGHINPVFNVPR